MNHGRRGPWWDATGWFAEGDSLLLRRVFTDAEGRTIREIFVVHDGNNEYGEITIWEQEHDKVDG